MWTHGILAPDGWGVAQRNDFHEPRFLHLTICRKAQNSLTWNIWFSFINGHLLMVTWPALCCKTPPSFHSPTRLLRAVLAGLLKIPVPTLKVLKFPMKWNIQLSSCECFSTRQSIATKPSETSTSAYSTNSNHTSARDMYLTWFLFCITESWYLYYYINSSHPTSF